MEETLTDIFYEKIIVIRTKIKIYSYHIIGHMHYHDKRIQQIKDISILKKINTKTDNI